MSVFIVGWDKLTVCSLGLSDFLRGKLVERLSEEERKLSG